VFQHYALFRHMTVAGNIGFGLRSRRRRDRPDKATIKRRVQELLALIQLTGHGPRFPEQLSGGQKQRVALARALAIDPTVLLLDEPFGALDAKVRVELRRWLRRLHEQTGQTTVFVTHDQEEALELADRVVVMRDGRIEQVGTPDEIYRQPASPFVYEFIGRTNCLAGQYAGGAFKPDGCDLGWPTRLDGSGSGRLYVRPHNLLLAAPGEGHPARVVSTHRLADRITLDLSLDGQELPAELDLAATSNVRVPDTRAQVWVRPLEYSIYCESDPTVAPGIPGHAGPTGHVPHVAARDVILVAGAADR
jgi:sulfate transport system ATP-binding protein